MYFPLARAVFSSLGTLRSENAAAAAEASEAADSSALSASVLLTVCGLITELLMDDTIQLPPDSVILHIIPQIMAD